VTREDGSPRRDLTVYTSRSKGSALKVIVSRSEPLGRPHCLVEWSYAGHPWSKDAERRKAEDFVDRVRAWAAGYLAAHP
jgi:hypothetical protein